jgi:predicted TIM-barrel fold metal-dependent hydrolase
VDNLKSLVDIAKKVLDSSFIIDHFAATGP